MSLIYILLIESAIISTVVFFYLIVKARIRMAFIYRDNLLIIAGSSIIAYAMLITVLRNNATVVILVTPVIDIQQIFCLQLIGYPF